MDFAWAARKPPHPWQMDGYGHGCDAALAAGWTSSWRLTGSLVAVPDNVPREHVEVWAEGWEHGYADVAASWNRT
jgi:hypothetical protein